MKILIAHNHYGSEAPSGENIVFNLELEMLKKNGQEVSTFERYSDEIRSKGILGLFIGGISCIFNLRSALMARWVAKRNDIEILHVHNSFPLISPAIFWLIGKRVARVITLHNYRIMCAGGLPFRGYNICMDCIDKQSILPAIKYGCYRNSRLATLPLALSILLHKNLGTWSKKVDAYIVLNEFQKNTLVKYNIPSEKIFIKPNFFPGNPDVISYRTRQDYVVFAGRLSREKGVEFLIRAWLAWGEDAPELRIFGDGPLHQSLADLALDSTANKIIFYGQVPQNIVNDQISRAKLLIVPSICFEGFPMVIREAFAYATPVACSNLGPLPNIVDDGVSGILFAPKSSQDLLEKVKNAFSGLMLESLSDEARKKYERHYTEEVNYQELIKIYNYAINRRVKILHAS